MRLSGLPEQIWQSQRVLLLSLAVLLIANLLAYVTIDQWLVPRVAENEARLLKRQTEVRQLLRNQGGATKTPEQLYMLADQDLAKFYQAVPDYLEFTGLIEELLVLSNRARLDIAQISYDAEGLKNAPLLKFNLNFNVTGDYERIKTFIHALEQSVRLITIRQISLQSADEEKVSLRLNLETHFRPGSREP